MESRNKLTMCRLCLCENECFFNIFEENDWHGYIAAEVISDLLQFNVMQSDHYPHVVCVTCLTKLTDFKVFKEQCQTSRVTYDDVFASNESLVEPQNDNECEEEEDDHGATEEDGSLGEEQGEGSYSDSEICREENQEDELTDEHYQELKSESLDLTDDAKSESEDIVDSLNDPSQQSPVRICVSNVRKSLSKGKRRRRRGLGLEEKLEIIWDLEDGSSPACQAYNLDKSAIRTVRKDNIKKGHEKMSSDRLGSDGMQNVEDLLKNDPQMQLILMETAPPPKFQQTPRRRKVITLGTKLKIIQKLESGMSAVAAGREYDMNESSVRTIWKMADKIKASAAHTGSLNARITRTRSPLLEKMEKLLIKWMEMQRNLGIPTSPSVVRSKALVIYDRLKKQQETKPGGEPFVASKGWYDRFCKRQKIQVLKVEKRSEEKRKHRGD